MAWIGDWCRRKKHTINVTANAGTNYQIGIKVYKGAGADGTEVVGGITMAKVYCGGNCQNDFGDIRFTASDGITLLPYWADPVNYVNGTSRVFWVKVSGDISAGNVDIYIYYNTAGATVTTSNFDNTFIFGDPWTNAMLDAGRWTLVDGNPVYSISVVNHYLEVTDMDANEWATGKGFHSKDLSALYGAYWILEDAYSGQGQALYMDSDVIAELQRVLTGVHHLTNWSAADYGIAFGFLVDGWAINSNARDYAGVGGNTDWLGATIAQPRTCRFRMWKLPDGNIRVEVDGVVRVNEANAEVESRHNLGIGKFTTYAFGTVRFYSFKIRKYVSPEPVHNTWAGEETPTVLAPTNCAASCTSPAVPYAITVTWIDNATNETAYYVERDDGGWHVISGALPAGTQTYIDNTVVCDTAYSYRVRAYYSGCVLYSGYCMIGAPVSCTCVVPPPEPEPEEIEKQHIIDAIKEWIWEYTFQFQTVERTYCIVIAPFGETTPIKGSPATLFEETRKVKGKTGERFEETIPSMIKSDIKKEFDETSINVVGPIGKRFEETKLIDIEWMFTLTVFTKIKGKTISKEEMLIDELYWL